LLLSVVAEYSGTPLVRKLGLKGGHVVVLLDAPAAWSIPSVDLEVEVRSDLRRTPDVVIAFVRSTASLKQQAARLIKALPADGSLWVAWPRKAGGHASDITENSLREEFLWSGLVDNKVAALDEDWSGLRFVWRRDQRAAIVRSRAGNRRV